MSASSIKLKVTYDDDSSVEVTAGQREMAEWETQPFGCATTNAMDEKPITFVRYLGWSALRRTKRLAKAGQSFSVWSDDVESVDIVDDEVDSDPTSADRPTGG